MFSRSSRIALGAFVLCLSLGQFASPEAGAVPAADWGRVMSGAAGGLVTKADIFRECIKVRSCWRTRSGRRACGLTDRCRTCTFVRKCRKGAGCAWEESCRWGRALPPIQQPVP